MEESLVLNVLKILTQKKTEPSGVFFQSHVIFSIMGLFM